MGVEQFEYDNSSVVSSDASFGSVMVERANEMEKTQGDEVKEVEAMAKSETNTLRAWKLIVVLSIIITATLVSTATYLFLQQDEESNYKESFKSFASTIEDAVEVHRQNLFSTMTSFSQSISGTAATSNTEFPFVTVPGFEILGDSARKQSGAELIFFTPRVDLDQLATFNTYTNANQGGWYEESKEFALAAGEGNLTSSDYDASGFTMPYIFDINEDQLPVPSRNPPFYPIWQTSPPPFSPLMIKANIAARSEFEGGIRAVETFREGAISAVFDFTQDGLATLAIKDEAHDSFHAQFVSADSTDALLRPHAVFVEPIFREVYNTSSDIVALAEALIGWDRYFANLLPDGITGITVVLANSCGQFFTYDIDGNTAIFVGDGDLHDKCYDDMKVEIPFAAYDNEITETVPGHCVYTFVVYPAKEFDDEYHTNLPIIMTVVVASTFFLMIMTFLVYDWFVQRRNNKVVGAAARSNAILSSMFPKNVRDRLFAEKKIEEEQQIASQKTPLIDNVPGNKTRLKNFMTIESRDHDDSESENDDFMYKTKPIADLFPETTILFADISGFTAWSSAREPAQVFTLLETIYKAFDDIAKRRRVFKVETIGDCYVAVTGLPDPRKDHAVAMARFARDCMHRMNVLVRKLEVVLGPDTAELAMRFGMHSGPVTAGVLRGERSRFQLFGDTMNTASRMESTGLRDRIQISQETADLLVAAGKSNWITPREEKVFAKGKGEMQTYWVAVSSSKTSSSESGTERSGSSDKDAAPVAANADTTLSQYSVMSAKALRLVKWNADVLANLLKQIQARRDENETPADQKEAEQRDVNSQDHTVLDEVQEIIHLPNYKGESRRDPDSIQLHSDVIDQLEEYVSTVASMYQDNPFHNFEHASHVTMSVVKLLSRIVAPDIDEAVGKDMASTLHDHTYGITSDPLVGFACVFSALIHDVDHTGVPNSQLIKENSLLASVYKNKSVAEQNSVDLSWDLLMDERYDELRAAIYSTDAERKRFRQLVVNSVMATDIMDKDLKTLRNNRWDKAFSENAHESEESTVDAADRKATIVIEHLIQASDISHTMQHWHIYRRWNARLFEEMYKAFLEGRAEKDPSEFWYQGEIGFYDFYIIPLAKKLKNCGVFGVSSDEYLNYALKNRREWEERGAAVVAELVEGARAKFVPPTVVEE